MTENVEAQKAAGVTAISDCGARLDREVRAAAAILGGAPLPLTLASASPRRRELLQRVLTVFDVCPADIPEVPQAGETPAQFARRAAVEKAADVAVRRPGRRVLGADTVVTVDGDILGKPRDAEDAVRMLRSLAGRTHIVITAVALIADAGSDRLDVTTEVTFRALSAREIDAYVATGDPFDKAGAYAIQGEAGAFATAVIGSYSNVIGLPLIEVARLLARRREPAPTD